MIRQEVLKRKHVGGVEILLLDAPGEKVNKLTEGLIQEFSDTLDQLEADETIQGVLIISGKERNFIAGADSAMLQKRETIEEFTELNRWSKQILNRIENRNKTVESGYHGAYMGGETEMI